MEPPAEDRRIELAREAFFAGLARQQAGDFAQAEQHYRDSLRLLPGRVSTLINLAATQLQLGRPQDALAQATAALAAEPDSVDALLHRATAEARLGRLAEALAGFDRLLELAPEHASAWSSHGGVLRELQRHDEAGRSFEQALRLGADAELNGFYLAAVQRQRAGDVPPKPPLAYVQGLFDSYADEFDRHLVGQLGYQGHRRLIEGLVAVAPGPYDSALDLGCGTGLCGPLLRPLVRRLAGVDLSARMLDRARALGVYDRLAQGDAALFLRSDEERHDLLVAADVFIYVGALEPVFAAAERAMDHGVFCFSVEVIDASGDGGAGYCLRPSLRYAHSRGYLFGLAAEHGFEVVSTQSAAVREDQQRAVPGLYVYLRRKR